MISPATRTYLYGITTAAMPLLIGFGAMTEGTSQQIALLAAAILVVTAPGLAAKNVPKSESAPAKKAATPKQVLAADGSLPQGAIVQA
jgi:hypothetical protein